MTTPGRILAVAAIVLGGDLAAAQHLVPVKDINTSTAYASDSLPSRPVQVGTVAYFTAVGTSSNVGLWKTDGTDAGTVLVREFPAGIAAGTLTGVDGTLYFQATDLEHGAELWKSDGTESGTVLVRDLRTGSASGSPTNFTAFSGRLYFSADDGVNGRELWMTDGTESGTTRIDIAPGSGSSSPSGFRAMGANLYFAATDGTSGQELWRADATGAAAMVRDISPGAASSFPGNLVASGGALLFVATEPSTGAELWRSDGTAAGTVIVRDANPGPGSSNPAYLTAVAGLVFYAGFEPTTGSELWKSDGTAAGTVVVKDVVPGSGGLSPLFVTAAPGGGVLFVGRDSTSGAELWRSDGTAAGTILVKDVNPGTASSSPTQLTAAGANVFFVADSSSFGQLWKTDGTAAGTTLLAGSDWGGGPQNLAALDSLLLYSSYQGGGRELWKSNGTGVGTTIVKNINNQRSSSITNATDAQGALYFSADDGNVGPEPWKSDGTAAGTFLLKDICAIPDTWSLCGQGLGSTPAGFTAFGGNVFFAATDNTNGREPWVTNGTPAGTYMLGNINYSINSSNPSDFVAYAGSLFFFADSTYNGREIFRTNGTTAGTVFFADINPGAASSAPSSLRYVNGQLFFQATTASAGTELWGIDGSLVPVMIKDIAPGTASSTPTSLTKVGSLVYFAANDGAHGVELWKSDGWGPRTVLVADVNPGSASSSPQALTAVGNSLFFLATDAATGTELWRSDGTGPGTTRVQDIRPGTASSGATSLTAVDTTLFFVANDGVHGAELWKSDGTDAGTVLVKDIVPGDGSPGVTSLVASNGVVFFSADDGVSGRELWVSDGTEDGTHLVGEVGPGSISAGVGGLAAAAGRIFFKANDGTTGSELWAFVNQAPQANAGPDRTVDLGTPVMLDGAASTDPDGDALHYEWLDNNGVKVADGPVYDVTLPLGTREFRLVARDGYGGVSMDFVRVTVTGSPELTVTVGGNENGRGSVAVNPPGTACNNLAASPQTCSYLTGGFTTVTLTATPDPDSVFVGWTGACTGTNPTCPLFMTEDRLVNAVFRGPQPLDVVASGVEGGYGVLTVTPSNAVCANTPGTTQACTTLHRVGTLVHVEAVPGPESVFVGWTGACSGIGSCDVSMGGPLLVTAIFRGPQPLDVVASGVEGGYGVLTVTPSNAVCANTPGTTQACTTLHRVGTLVHVEAVPGPESVFVGWTGACSGFGSCDVSMGGPLLVTALFRGPQPLDVVATSAGGGFGRLTVTPSSATCANSPGGTQACTTLHRVGTLVHVDAVPSPESVFVGWTDACTGSGSCDVVMDGPRLVTAIFRLANRAPTAVAGGPYSAPRGQAISFDGTASTDPDGDALTYRWDFGDGSTGSGPTPTHAYAALGAHVATLTVNDGALDSAPATVTVSIVNRPPVVDIGGPYAARHGAAVAFDASHSTDADGDTLTFAWTFGDGATGSGANPSHVYAADGDHPVTLEVSDGTDTVTASATVHVTNEVPVASAGGPYSGFKNVAFTLDGSGSSDGNGDALTYRWDFGDGATGSGAHPSHTYAIPPGQPSHVYTASLVVSDGITDSAAATASVEVLDHAPHAEAAGASSGFRNQPVTFDASGSSDEDGDALAYRWDFGDGGTSTERNPAHAYAAFGGYTARLIVNDGHLDSAPAFVAVTIVDRAPVASAGGPYAAFRGAAITFDGSGSSDPDGNPLTYAWDFGDGSAPGTGVSPAHAYASLGTFTVRLVVTDGATASAPAFATVTISNRGPVANAGGPYSGVRGTAVLLSGAGSSDPDGEPLTYRWTFGDGGTSTLAAPSHTYATLGTFTVTLIVNDGHVDSAAAATTVTITNRAPTAGPGGPYAGLRGVAVAFNGSASADPDGDPLTYAWTFGDGATGTGKNPTHAYSTLGTFTVSLTVNDGLTSSPPVTTTVTVSNRPPIANAGPDRTVVRRTSVTLDGRASSDPDGTITAFAWRQLTGPTVSLTNANTSQPRFTAPNVSSTTTLSFELKVTDNNGATATDTIVVTVTR